jgi:hypothetical protein
MALSQTAVCDKRGIVLGRPAETLTVHFAKNPCQNCSYQNMARKDFGIMLHGYARVPTTNQKPELQIGAQDWRRSPAPL